MAKTAKLETLVSLAKRRGFVWPASDVYGGVSGFYNYGPYGAQMLQNLKEIWWHDFVQIQPNIVGLNSSIIQNPEVWKASGHLQEFTDPLVKCKKCHSRFREDDIDISKPCPSCSATKSFVSSRQFNLMFKTSIGAVEDESAVAYLRPETAGAMFTDFNLIREASRQRVPFGIAQIGKAFRNEISPREFLFRMREFEQAELEYFVHPKEAKKEFERWLAFCKRWLADIGISKGKISEYEHSAKERSHYSAKTVDLMYQFPFGKKELWGVANRTDYDLKVHSKGSGKDLSYFDQANNEKYLPYVIEPSLGLDRLFLAVLDSAYHEEKVKGETRVLLKLANSVAPVKVAVLPLSKDAKLSPLAKKVYKQISGEFTTEYDETQSIGKRYRRQDEIGTPFCVTVDFDSLEDKAVTIRDRDSMRQERVKITKLASTLEERL